MENLKECIVRSGAGRRPTTRRPERDDADAIAVTSANELHTASAFFLAGTPDDERGARMDALRRSMAKFQDRDMVIVALAVGAVGEA